MDAGYVLVYEVNTTFEGYCCILSELAKVKNQWSVVALGMMMIFQARLNSEDKTELTKAIGLQATTPSGEMILPKTHR